MQTLPQTTASVNWAVATEPTGAAQLIKELRTIAYRCGFDAYCDGQRLEDMQTEDMRRGWWAALNADAACASGYDVKAVR